MKIKKVIFAGIIFTILLSGFAFANSAPMVSEEAPGFSMAPVGTTSILVTKEDLKFDMTANNGRTAYVTASYEMENTSDAQVEQLMLFPYVTSYNRGFLSSVKITAGGQAVPFKAVRLEDIPLKNTNSSLNYLGNANKELADKIEISNIVKMLNNTEYIPKNYILAQPVSIYTLHLPRKDEQYKAEISFNIDTKKNKILYYNFNGISVNDDGSVKMSAWAAAKAAGTTRENAYVVIFGQGSSDETVIKSLTGQDITVENKTMGEFLKEYVVRPSLLERQAQNEEDLNLYVIKQLDTKLNNNGLFLDMNNDVAGAFYNSTFVEAFLYTVKFEPQSRLNVTVEYQMNSTLDRRETKEFSDMFLYLLRPAAGWKDFGSLLITVIPNNSKPYIIDSSLPLTKDNNTGIYSGTFATLPDKDFYFTLYSKDKADGPKPNNGIPGAAIVFLFVIFIFMLAVIVLIVWLVSRKLKRQQHGLKKKYPI